MKRLLAIILCTIMVMQVSVVAFAADEVIPASITADENTLENLPASDVVLTSVGEEQQKASINEFVNFEVQIQMDLPITQEGIDLIKDAPMVSLQSSESVSGTNEAEHFHAQLKEVKDKTIIFEAQNVPSGDYVLSLTSEYYFLNHTQNVTIKDGIKTTLVFSDSYNSYRGDGKTSPGVFAIGDLNNDNVIDKKDSDLILDNIGQKATVDSSDKQIENSEFKSIYDINQDGKIDVGDLSVLAYNMNKTKRDAKAIETVLTTAVKVNNEQNNAVVQGERKLDTIMQDEEETIKVGPADSQQAVSTENPIAIEMDFEVSTQFGAMIIEAPAQSGPTKGTVTIETVNPTDPNAPGEKIEAVIVDEGSDESVVENQPVMKARSARKSAARSVAAEEISTAKAIRKADGSIVIELGRQIPVKKVTIIITETASSTNLAEIAKVEFLNDMQSRIPEPEMNIPENIQAEGVGDSFTVTWSAQTNVTGYEVSVSAKDKNGKVYASRTYKAGVNQIKIESFKGGAKDKVTPLWTYYVKVRSINGSWSSPYSETIEHYQLAGKKPDAPDNVKVSGKYRQLDVSWKDMTGTEKYTVEYREKGTQEYTAIHDIETNYCSITGLKDATTYEVRVYGWNTDNNGNLQRGANSLPALGKTTVEIPQFSKYAMVTRDEITNVSCFATMGPGGPGGFDLTQYEDGIFKNEYIVDGDYTTYMHTNKGYPHGAYIDFEEEIEVKEFLMTTRLEDAYRDSTGYSQVIVEAWDANGTKVSVPRSSISVVSLHPTAKNTMKFTLASPVKAKRLRFALSKYGAGVVTISELAIFKYDSLEDDVNNLYADDMHVTLRNDVTLAEIEALENRANTKDTVWDEYHPKKDLLLSELSYAKELLFNKDIIGDVVNVKEDITKGDVSRINFAGGLSGYQPLGYVAKSGSKINVYVGQKGKKVGDSVPVRLVFAQYHAESAAWHSGEIALYHGKNEIEIPDISSLDFEKGGSLYIVHTNPSNVKSNPVEIRVSGAVKIPTLDLHRTIGNDRLQVNEAEWKATIKTYVEQLNSYVSNLPASHEAHKEIVGDYEYGNGSNCFLNSTEISLDNVLMSVPASKILEGLRRGNANADIETLTDNMYNSVVAMNQMIELFYKERGFNPALRNGTQGIPTARFNIRYHRMFAGAFMYAGGLHLGIEYGSVTGLATGTPIVVDENGKRTGGQLFGWGIAHELGHNADVSGLTYAEVTNNIWSQFEKSWDTAGTSRIPYSSVYKHVTSNTVGKPSNVFAQLGMYWQLHLAYDKNYTGYNYYKTGFTTENYETMLANEFFARYYAINRDTSLAPKPQGIKISGGTTDQNIMRTACAAAEKDLTDFFRAWGLEVDAVTAAYAAQFEKETRKIQYLNDAAHEYTLGGGSPMADSTKLHASLEQGTGVNAKKVKLTMSLSGCDNMDAILGYEIIRNGKPVAFVEPSKETAETVYEDVIATENNRVMEYAVVVYDKYLNSKEANSLPMIKIRHDGVLPTDNWTVTTNTTSNAGVLTVYENTKVTAGGTYYDVAKQANVVYNEKMDIKYLDSETGELVSTHSAANMVYDGNPESSYEGSVTSGLAEITIDLGGKQEITALKFLGSTTKNWSFGVEYSDNGGASFKAVSGFVFKENLDSYGTRALYFASGDGNKNIRAIKATHLRITSSKWNSPLSLGICEMALLAPSGDNVDIGVSTVDEATGVETWSTDNAIGILNEDYILDESTGAKIPAGSFIVTGQYTGNAAFNVVKLYNEKHVMFDESTDNKLGSIVNGYQSFFADMPDEGNIVNVKDGFWIYWLEPLSGENAGKYGIPQGGENGEDIVVELPTKVHAELYRVDNALTLAGERLVSNSFTVDVPQTLSHITLKSEK